MSNENCPYLFKNQLHSADSESAIELGANLEDLIKLMIFICYPDGVICRLQSQILFSIERRRK